MVFRACLSGGPLYDGAIQALEDGAPKGEQSAYAQLRGSLCIALRTNRRIYQEVSQPGPGGIDLERAMQALDPKSLSFELFQAMLMPSEQPQNYLQQYCHFLRLDLILELGVITAGEVLSHPQTYSPDREAQLAEFLVRTTRELENCALQLGILQEGSDPEP